MTVMTVSPTDEQITALADELLTVVRDFGCDAVRQSRGRWDVLQGGRLLFSLACSSGTRYPLDEAARAAGFSISDTNWSVAPTISVHVDYGLAPIYAGTRHTLGWIRVGDDKAVRDVLIAFSGHLERHANYRWSLPTETLRTLSYVVALSMEDVLARLDTVPEEERDVILDQFEDVVTRLRRTPVEGLDPRLDMLEVLRERMSAIPGGPVRAPAP